MGPSLDVLRCDGELVARGHSSRGVLRRGCIWLRATGQHLHWRAIEHRAAGVRADLLRWPLQGAGRLPVPARGNRWWNNRSCVIAVPAMKAGTFRNFSVSKTGKGLREARAPRG